MTTRIKVRLIKAALRRYKHIKILEFRTIIVQKNVLDVLFIKVNGRIIIIGSEVAE